MSMKRFVYLLSLSVIITFCFTVKAQTTRAIPTGNLPLLENFNREDLVGKLPEGWATAGSNLFKVGAFNGGWVKPYSEPYNLMVSPVAGSSVWVYTPGYQMYKGHTYHIKFALLAPGYFTTTVAGENIKITYGDAQAATAQAYVIKDMPNIPNPNKKIEWSEVTTSFVAENDGIYCIGINVYNAVGNSLGIDNFELYDLENPPTAIPKFKTDGGIWDASNDGFKSSLRYVYPDQPIKFTNESQYATSYSWDTFGDPANTSEENPTVCYSKTGNYEVTLSAINHASTEVYKSAVNVTVLGDEEISAVISNRGPYDALPVPHTVEEGAWWDYVQGINKYSNMFAERIELPAYATASVSAASLMLYDYKLAYPDFYKPVTVKICGEKYGAPDLSNVLGSCVTTMVECFGEEDVFMLPGETVNGAKVTRKVTFPTPVEVKGSFYIVYDVDKSVVANSSTYIGLLSVFKDNLKSNAYVYLDDAAAEKLSTSAGWYRADKFPKTFFPDFSFEGLSFYIAPKLTFHKIPGLGVNTNTQNDIKVFPTVFEQEFTIETEGKDLQMVEVYDTNGQKVYETKTTDRSVTVNASAWAKGMYFVSVKGGVAISSTKVIKL